RGRIRAQKAIVDHAEPHRVLRLTAARSGTEDAASRGRLLLANPTAWPVGGAWRQEEAEFIRSRREFPARPRQASHAVMTASQLTVAPRMPRPWRKHRCARRT